MINSYLFLILASCEINGKGFWIIDLINNDSGFNENNNILECHKKELIGIESSKNILYAINLNLDNLINEIRNEGFKLDNPPKGIPFNIPLTILEDIFDFWLDRYKNKLDWDTCIGLLKIKRRTSLSNIIHSKVIKGNSKKWAPIIENLHKYRPNESKEKIKNKPMWT